MSDARSVAVDVTEFLEAFGACAFMIGRLPSDDFAVCEPVGAILCRWASAICRADALNETGLSIDPRSEAVGTCSTRIVEDAGMSRCKLTRTIKSRLSSRAWRDCVSLDLKNVGRSIPNW